MLEMPFKNGFEEHVLHGLVLGDRIDREVQWYATKIVLEATGDEATEREMEEGKHDYKLKVSKWVWQLIIGHCFFSFP